MSKTYIIYQIRPLDKSLDYSYVGSTQNFTRRKSEHKVNCCCKSKPHYNLPIYKFIRENGDWKAFEMKPLEEYKCDTILQGKIREQYWIDNTQSKLNSIKAYSGLIFDEYETMKDYKKAYQILNCEELKVKKKKYRTMHQEHIKKYNKNYRDTSGANSKLEGE